MANLHYSYIRLLLVHSTTLQRAPKMDHEMVQCSFCENGPKSVVNASSKDFEKEYKPNAIEQQTLTAADDSRLHATPSASCFVSVNGTWCISDIKLDLQAIEDLDQLGIVAPLQENTEEMGAEPLMDTEPAAAIQPAAAVRLDPADQIDDRKKTLDPFIAALKVYDHIPEEHLKAIAYLSLRRSPKANEAARAAA